MQLVTLLSSNGGDGPLPLTSLGWEGGGPVRDVTAFH